MDPFNICSFGLQDGLRALQTLELEFVCFVFICLGFFRSYAVEYTNAKQLDLEKNHVGQERKQGFLPPLSVFTYALVMYKSISYHMLSTPVCSCFLGQSVVLSQPAVVQLQASGVLPASQPVIAVTGETTQLHSHTVNALPPAAGNGSTSGKIPVTKPLLQSTTPATGLDVSSDCVMKLITRQSCSWACLVRFLTVNREFGSLGKNGEEQLNICWPAWSCRPAMQASW